MNSYRQLEALWGVPELLNSYPLLTIAPSRFDALRLEGDLAFSAVLPNYGQVDDVYTLQIRVSNSFPRRVPEVRELGQKKVEPSFHTNPDGTLCLGSPLRVNLALAGRPTLTGFVENCVIPFLANYTYFKKTGLLPSGELDHGRKGALTEYKEMFGVKTDDSCVEVLRLLGCKKRIANKRTCPCGNGKRFGRCHGPRCSKYRKRLSRTCYAAEAAFWRRK